MVGRYSLGLDLGSTTVKLVLLSPDGDVLETKYTRHGTAVRQTLAALLRELDTAWPHLQVCVAVSGSAALGLAETVQLPFVQEVMATARMLNAYAPETDTAIELGGEDAKILYLSQGMDLRMNEACAGGTGAFIDQMAALLHTDAAGLNALASRHRALYPIASRCGVFAKTDVVSLLNEGVPREDIAASIFQAVAGQTVGGLACGNPIRGRVAFLGGPLHFLPELKKRFVATLGLRADAVVDITLPHFTAALGAALCAMGEKAVPLADLVGRTEAAVETAATVHSSLPPLFASDDALRAFRNRHAGEELPSTRLGTGPLYLGLDFGSTTVKAVLTDADGNTISSRYGANQGDPVSGLRPWLITLLQSLPASARIAGCCATGYGAELARAALGADWVEVETIAHLRAACRLLPDVSYVVDIGGQDMKCLKVENGLVAGVTLNEACSAGCGAFLENFARSLGLDMDAFVQAALQARHPVDLGSRCTVFMTSKVRQAQKEGADIGDIAAGLCYSVARNALYKVLRIRTPAELGNRVIVQGGSFRNDALLRAMELLLNKEVTRPARAELMGAYGAALTARKRSGLEGRSGLRSATELASLQSETVSRHCSGCGNRCLLTVHIFSGGRKLISGNRCERGNGEGRKPEDAALNMYAWKVRRLFEENVPLEPDKAPRGRIGLPRVLNMYEFYPFWLTLFTRLGFRVELSGPSDKASYLRGLESVPSQTLCFPAKLAHGHVEDLIARGVKDIFYPCMPRTGKEDAEAADTFLCPVVCSYPEAVRLNCDGLAEQGVRLHTPFVRPDRPQALVRTLCAVFGLPRSEVRRAAAAAAAAQAAYEEDVRRKGQEVLETARRLGRPAIVLAGRPYHVDPLVHHGLADLIVSLGAAVLTEDGVAHLAPAPQRPLRVVDQWTWHGRLYRAARLVAASPDLELVQLTSFGCGLDAITADQVHEILRDAGKIHTLIKIDEGESLGAARIRLRSLLAALEERRASVSSLPAPEMSAPRAAVAQHAVRRHAEGRVILAPQMSPLHFRVIEAALRGAGYELQVLRRAERADVETGLRYVNNDACYPSVLVIGQLVRALLDGRYDPAHTALLLAQTCGPCRATNYIALLRKALTDAGFPEVPVLSVNRGRPGQPSLPLSAKLLHKLIISCLYADMLQRLSLACRTYERRAGATDDLLESWLERACAAVACNGDSFARDMLRMAYDFSAVSCDVFPKPRVGVVGEILLRYHPTANNNILTLIREEGGEPVLTDLTDFLLYCLTDSFLDYRLLGGRAMPAFISWCVHLRIERLRDAMRAALAKNASRLPGAAARPVTRITDLAAEAGELIALGHRAGEGWLLTADMLEFTAHGIPNVLCLQPFGCLPNHVTGKGVIKAVKQLRPLANVAAVDYDPGSSETNQNNRIKLFMSMARERLKQTGDVYAPVERPRVWAAERFMPGAFMLPDNLLLWAGEDHSS